MDDLLSEIEAFRQTHGMAASTFGRLAINDPDLVKQLAEAGREPRRRTVERVRHFIATYRPQQVAA